MGLIQAALALILGFVVPFIVVFLVRAAWPAWGKFLIALVVSGVASVLTLWSQGQLTGVTLQTFLPILGMVILGAEAMFALFVKTVPGLQAWLEGHVVK
jgi:hypothetical protein